MNSVKALRGILECVWSDLYHARGLIVGLKSNPYVGRRVGYAVQAIDSALEQLAKLHAQAYQVTDCDCDCPWRGVALVARALERTHELSLRDIAETARREGAQCWFEFSLSPGDVERFAADYEQLKGQNDDTDTDTGQ